MSLNIQKRRVGTDVIVLGLTGGITLGRECQEVECQIEDLLKGHEKKIIFDFSEVTYLDSTGVGMLVMCFGKVKQAGGELSVAGAHGIVEQTLKMTRVDQIVALHGTVEAAVNLTPAPPLGQPARRSESKGGDFVPLHAETRRIGGAVLVTCAGRIVACPQLESLRDQIKSLLPESRDIVLHLGEVTFIDSSGLGMLVRLLASARAAGGDIKLCNVPREIDRTLRITNLITLFDTHETELEAISAFYQRRTSSTRATTPSQVPILCVDRSTDVLAYLRELLLRAGYNPLTNNNIHDSLILLTAARPKLVILGPNTPSEHPGQIWERFRKAAMCLPVVELEHDFSSREAGQAGAQLLGTVRLLLSPKS